jgi:phosphoenolpyruvate carboxykinase (diphosphate)
MKVNRDHGIGINPLAPTKAQSLVKYINLKLASMGLPHFEGTDNRELETAWDLIEHFREKDRLLTKHLCPGDTRIQNFLDTYLADTGEIVKRLPSNTFILDKHGLGRVLSLPADKDEYVTDLISSYRIKQGVLHNPKSDKRTTKGSFHVVEGGLPIPFDKKAVPKVAFARILSAALNPDDEMLKLPFTSSQENQAKTFVSLLLRPTVCPEVPGCIDEKAMEIRFFVPGSLISNMDFVESIFGNGGDPLLPENDALLNPKNWTGTTGCIILAPQITKLKKKDLGLPPISEATERQKKMECAGKKRMNYIMMEHLIKLPVGMKKG